MRQDRMHGPAKLLLGNARDFLNAGLGIVFTNCVTPRDVKVGVVSIQTAIELLLKYRLVKENGLATIVNGPTPQGDLVAAAVSGSLRTIGYGKGLGRIREIEGLSETEEELFRRVQALRNALVHFTADVDVGKVKMELAWVLIGALSMLAAGEERDQGEMQTHARFLDPKNFRCLINFGPYRDQSVDSAIKSRDSEAVLRCWECGVDALSVRPSETYFCHCCGLTADFHMARFAACARCGQADGVCFDPLNETHGVHRGKCLHCETFVGVVVCSSCGGMRSQVEGVPAQACRVCSAQ